MIPVTDSNALAHLDSNQQDLPINRPASPTLALAIYLADQNPHRDRSLGITAMTRSLIDQFTRRSDLRISQMISRSSFAHEHPRVESTRLPFRTDRTAGRLVADSVHPWMTRMDADVWYYPKGYVSRLVRPSAPAVGTMHDAIVQYYADRYPDTRSARAFRYWIGNTKRSLQTFHRVLTISQHAASQLKAFCDRHQIPTPEIEVTYEGSFWETQRDFVYQKSSHVVHLASSAPHKGTNRMLRHWLTLQERGQRLPPLQLVGNLDLQGHETFAKLRDISLVPAQQTGELQQTIGHAAALILPSEIEGFGLPALEAYYVGTPVCYVKETSVEEVVGESGSQGGFSLDDVDEFQRALDWSLSVSKEEVDRISSDLYGKFSMKRIADRVVGAFWKTIDG